MSDIFKPLTGGEAYCNSKTKVYSDGTTNMIACVAPVFKDPSFVSVESEKKRNQKLDDLLSHIHDKEHLKDFVKFLEERNMNGDDFKKLIVMSIEEDKDFLVALREKNITLQEYDYYVPIYSRLYPKAKSKNTNDPRHDSVKRAKDGIFDYILNNDFEYFFTGTINPEKLDSKDPKVLIKPLIKWLNNMQQRYGLEYLMIAEHHKSGRIHFHGLFKSEIPLKLEDSGTKIYRGHKKPIGNTRALQMGLSDGRTVYNLKTWKFGFSTCVALTGDRMNTAFYVTKYITKDCKKIFGKFFWHSRSLKKPDVLYADVDYEMIDSLDCNGYKYIFSRGEVQKNET